MKLHRKRIPDSDDVRIVDSSGEDIGRTLEDGTIVYPGNEGLKVVQSVNACTRMRDELDAANKELARLQGNPYKPEKTDLRAICRRSDTCLTTVSLRMSWADRDFEWLVLGEAQLTSRDGGNKGWQLRAYLTSGVTDFEHDSGYALRLPLIGCELDSVYYHSTHIVGYIDPELRDHPDFHVPRSGYNPMKHEDAIECEECEGDPHIIVPEGRYVPPFDIELFEAVKGKRVEIHIGPVVPKDDEDES